MGHYNRYERPPMPTWEERLRTAHPLWGPLGCVFAVLIFVMGYALAVLALQSETVRAWLTIPPNLLVKGSDPLLLVKGLLALVFAVVVYALLSLIYAVLAKAVQATPTTPLDVRTPVRRRRRRSPLRLLRLLIPYLSLMLGVATIVKLRGQAWFQPPQSLQVPGPLPDAVLYLIATAVWWFVLQLALAGLNALLVALGQRYASTAEEED